MTSPVVVGLPAVRVPEPGFTGRRKDVSDYVSRPVKRQDGENDYYDQLYFTASVAVDGAEDFRKVVLLGRSMREIACEETFRDILIRLQRGETCAHHILATTCRRGNDHLDVLTLECEGAKQSGIGVYVFDRPNQYSVGFIPDSDESWSAVLMHSASSWMTICKIGNIGQFYSFCDSVGIKLNRNSDTEDFQKMTSDEIYKRLNKVTEAEPWSL